ncbi:MAG: S24 family peptidase [Desulfovibrio sp.]|jgi:hypothetical protein|nr:S24 family peptidase [Desulfovibrio sp.]
MDTDTYQQIAACLQEALNRCGGLRADLMKKLGAEKSRATLYKALDRDHPILPNPDLLCPWLDAIGVEISMAPVPGTEPGETLLQEIRMARPLDLTLPLEDRPGRGVCVLRAESLRRRGLDPYAVVGIDAVHGMPPTILPGDLLFVDACDRAQMTVADGQIHVLQYGDGADSIVLRRIQRLAGGGVRMTSDTPGIEPETVNANDEWPFDILGHVVGILHWHIAEPPAPVES